MEENILGDLQLEDSLYITIESLKKGFDKWEEGQGCVEGGVILYVKEALDNFRKSVDVSGVSKEVRCVVEGIIKDKVDYSKLCLEKEYEIGQVQGLLSRLYELINRNQGYKESIFCSKGLVQRRITYLKTCKIAVSRFVDPFLEGGKKEKKECIELFLTDVESELLILNDLKAEIKDLGEVIGNRYNLLMRSESSIRLVSKFQSMEFGANRVQSGRHTTVGVNGA